MPYRSRHSVRLPSTRAPVSPLSHQSQGGRVAMQLRESVPRAWHCQSIRHFVPGVQSAGMLFVNQHAGSDRQFLQMLPQRRVLSECKRQADGKRVQAPPRAQVEGMPRTLVPTTKQPLSAHHALALHRSAPHEYLCHPLVHGHRLTLLHSPPHGLDGLWHRWLRSGRAAQRDCTNGTHGRISTWKISTS